MIPPLLGLLGHPDRQIHTCAAGILFNLTCNNADNKLALCSANGIVELVQALDKFGAHRDLLDAAAGTLKHVSNGHEHVRTFASLQPLIYAKRYLNINK